MMELSGRQKRHLRGLGHHLEPVVQIGRAGVSPAVIEQTQQALEAHELVKLRFGQAFEDDLAQACASLAAATGAAVAGRIGRTALLYRRHPEDPVIELP